MHHYVTEQSWHAIALVQESTKMSPIVPNDYTPFIIIYMYTYINNCVRDSEGWACSLKSDHHVVMKCVSQYYMLLKRLFCYKDNQDNSYLASGIIEAGVE